jgi:hypothetical protein
MPFHRSFPTLLLTTVVLLVGQTLVSAGAIHDVALYCDPSCTILDQSGTGQASGSASLIGGTVSGFADATGGILHASASYNSLAPGSVGGQVNGNAQFFDEVTIDSPGLDGTTRFLTLHFAVTGTTSSTAANAIVAPFVNCSGPTGSSPNCQSLFVTGDAELVFQPVAITLGQAFGLDLNLDAVVFFGPGNPVSAVSDFSHTAILNGISVSLNSDGTGPVSNLTFSSADGITYSQGGIIPEPNSFSLLAVGLLVSALIYWKRRERGKNCNESGSPT